MEVGGGKFEKNLRSSIFEGKGVERVRKKKRKKKVNPLSKTGVLEVKLKIIERMGWK